MELRCDSGILHGKLVETNVVEVSCRSARCGKRPGNVVLHKYNLTTGELLSTSIFQQPKEKEVNSNGHRCEQGSSVRVA